MLRGYSKHSKPIKMAGIIYSSILAQDQITSEGDVMRTLESMVKSGVKSIIFALRDAVTNRHTPSCTVSHPISPKCQHKTRDIAAKWPLFCLAGAMLLSGCSQSYHTTQLPQDPVIPASTAQLVVVVSDNWDASSGQIYQFSRTPGQPWQQTGQTDSVDLGRNGTAWGIGLHPQQNNGPQKQEGDGKAPAGLFRLSAAFGALPALVTQMPYQQMSRFDFCIDVPTSPLYNQTVDVRQFRDEWTAGSSEPMRRDLITKPDAVYEQGLFIDHNFSDGEARQTGAGSCIFMHLKSPDGRKTAGCTALAPAHLTALLQWLKPAERPLYLLLPVSEYRRLQTPWQLPALPVAG